MADGDALKVDVCEGWTLTAAGLARERGGRTALLGTLLLENGKLVHSDRVALELPDSRRAYAEAATAEDRPSAEEIEQTILRLLPEALAAVQSGGTTIPDAPLGGEVDRSDFYAYLPEHRYIFRPTRELWSAAGVNGRLGTVRVGLDTISIAAYLDRTRAVEQMSWAPGKPELIEGQLLKEGGWIAKPGATCYNLYIPPAIAPGNPDVADRWLEHVHVVYPDDAEHILDWLAHRVQHPSEKINHILVLGGTQGIGKDSLLEPVKQAVGPWNVAEVSPLQLLGRFNGFVKSVILRISEVRDLGDGERGANRYSLYEHLKVYAAAPPDVLRVDEKNRQEIHVPNLTGVIITTNHKHDGLYLPAEDRRHYVAWSERQMDDFGADYWRDLHQWYAAGGSGHVAAYLAARDLSHFDPKAPPPKTAAFWDMVDAGRAPEDAELADVLDKRHTPDAITLGEIIAHADANLAAWLAERRNSRKIPHRLEANGYVRVRNQDANDGLWRIAERRQNVYAKASLSPQARYAAACKLAGAGHER